MSLGPKVVSFEDQAENGEGDDAKVSTGHKTNTKPEGHESGTRTSCPIMLILDTWQF